jgi:uncharacterized protein (TIGR03435 family)
VVSIKPNRTGAPGMINRTPPDGYSVENMTPRIILSDAFGIRADLISGGPGWLDSDHYDLIAKVAGDDLAAYHALSKEQRGQMLQAVLADRFQLVVHTVTKELPGYNLTIAKGGFKLQPVPGDKRGGWGAGFGDIKATATSIATLCTLLSQQLQQTVVDQTGLTGLYSFHLQWEQDHPRASGSADAAVAEPSGLPALPTALEEQLGLKLVPTKVPVESLIVDRIERPTEN